VVEGEKVTQVYVRFSGAGLELEGILHLPAGEGPFPAVAVCHPHPLYGGDMHNNVVLAICHALAKASIAALRFNFRGVGQSEGDFAEGVGEQEDVISALAFLSSVSQVDPNKIGLAGYSFGTQVALPVAPQSEQVKAMALVSPFLSAWDWEQLKSYVRPKLFLCGDKDYFVSRQEVQRLVSGLPQPSQYEVISGADHFWWGYEGEMAEKVSTFFGHAFTTMKESSAGL
jgi:alpha/beta superfamily hydrolase